MHPQREYSIRVERAIMEINAHTQITDEIVLNCCKKYRLKKEVVVKVAGFTNDWRYPDFKK